MDSPKERGNGVAEVLAAWKVKLAKLAGVPVQACRFGFKRSSACVTGSWTCRRPSITLKQPKRKKSGQSHSPPAR